MIVNDPRAAYRARALAQARADERSKRAACRAFGITSRTTQPPRMRARARELTDLFGDLRHFCDIGEKQAFYAAIPDEEEANAALVAFIRDVHTCPDVVETFVRWRIADAKTFGRINKYGQRERK